MTPFETASLTLLLAGLGWLMFIAVRDLINNLKLP